MGKGLVHPGVNEVVEHISTGYRASGGGGKEKIQNFVFAPLKFKFSTVLWKSPLLFMFPF